MLHGMNQTGFVMRHFVVYEIIMKGWEDYA